MKGSDIVKVKLYRYAELYIFNFRKTIYGNVCDVIGKDRFHRADSGGSRTYSFDTVQLGKKVNFSLIKMYNSKTKKGEVTIQFSLPGPLSSGLAGVKLGN